MARRKRTTAYGHGRIRETVYGTFAADLSVGRGTRLRQSFKTRRQAEAWIDAQASLDGPPMTPEQFRDAMEAFSLLPEGASLAAFVRAHGVGSSATLAEEQELGALLEVYLDECQERLRADTMTRYRRFLPAALASPMLGRDLARHTTAAIRDYLAAVSSAHTKRHVRSALSSFYDWLILHDKMTDNPTKRVRVPTVARKTPAVLSVAEAEHLLNVAADWEGGCCLAYVAVCLFAGLRPTEARRLRVSDIRREFIVLSETQTKTGTARTVSIRPNLRAILDRCDFPCGTVIPCAFSSFHVLLTRFISATGLDWVQDVMRHSFASYAYEQSRSADATAFEMGHRGTGILFAHYRGLVDPGDGDRYFSLLPRAFGNNLARWNISI